MSNNDDRLDSISLMLNRKNALIHSSKLLNKGKPCPECKTELPKYPMYNDKYEIYVCPKCGKRVYKERYYLINQRTGKTLRRELIKNKTLIPYEK